MRSDQMILSELTEDALSTTIENVIVESKFDIYIVWCAIGQGPEWSGVFNSLESSCVGYLQS